MTNVLLFILQAKENTPSNSGKPSLIVSIRCLSQLWSSRKSYVCTGVLALNWQKSRRYWPSIDLLTFPRKACSVTFYGQIQLKIKKGGSRINKEASATCLELMSSRNFWKSMTLTSSADHIKYQQCNLDSRRRLWIFREKTISYYLFSSELLRNVRELGSCSKRGPRANMFISCNKTWG